MIIYPRPTFIAGLPSIDKICDAISCHPVLILCGGSDQKTGPRLNIKTVLFMYGDFHVKDKTAVRTSYL